MKHWILSGAGLAFAGMLGLARTALGQAACVVDDNCDCGQVCSWAPPNNVNHICVDASGGDPGWCDVNTDCLYQGQTCVALHCAPAWAAGDTCTKGGGASTTAGATSSAAASSTGAAASSSAAASSTAGGGTSSGAGTTGGTTGGTTSGTTGSTGGLGTTGGVGTTGGTTGALGPPCQNDVDCDCNQVCSWTHADPGCSNRCGNCVDGSSGDPGWCSDNNSSADCLYANQTCSFPVCTPPYQAGVSVCLKGQSTTGGAGTTGGGTTGGGTTGGGTGGTPCTNDVDCACGQVCSWLPPHQVNHVCVSADGGDPGWCNGNDSQCLYLGQTCDVTACTPAWSATSVCSETQGTSGGGTTTGGTGPDAGSTSGGGSGCSTAGGSFALMVGVLAIGILTRRRQPPR